MFLDVWGKTCVHWRGLLSFGRLKAFECIWQQYYAYWTLLLCPIKIGMSFTKCDVLFEGKCWWALWQSLPSILSSQLVAKKLQLTAGVVGASWCVCELPWLWTWPFFGYLVCVIFMSTTLAALSKCWYAWIYIYIHIYIYIFYFYISSIYVHTMFPCFEFVYSLVLDRSPYWPYCQVSLPGTACCLLIV